MTNIKFILNGCDISLYDNNDDVEIKIGYDSIEKLDTPEREIPCRIKEE